MERRLNASETSLDAPMRSDEQGERSQGDFVRASSQLRPDNQVESGEFGEILRAKLHAFGATLRDAIWRSSATACSTTSRRRWSRSPSALGSRASACVQIEERLKKRLRQYLEGELGDAVEISDQVD